MNPENPPTNPTSPVPTQPVPTPPAAAAPAIPAEQPFEPIEIQTHRYGGFTRRFIATQIDGIIIFVAIFIVSTILTFLTQAAGKNSPVMTAIFIIFQILFLFVGPIYTIYFLLKTGSTPGKKVLHLKVISATKEPLTIGRLFLREVVGKFLSGFFGSLGYFWFLFDGHRQAWHDKMAHTLVIDTRDMTPEAYSLWKSKEKSALPPFLFLSAATPLFFLLLIVLLFQNSIFQVYVIKSFSIITPLLIMLLTTFALNVIVDIIVGIYLLKEQRFSPFLEGKPTKIGVGTYIFFQVLLAIVILISVLASIIYGVSNYHGPTFDSLPSSQTQLKDLEQSYPELHTSPLNSL